MLLTPPAVTNPESALAKPVVMSAATPPAVSDAKVFPRPSASAKRASTHQAHQIIFSGVIAFSLILVGANLSSIYALFSQPRSQSSKALKAGKPVHRATIISRQMGVPVIEVTFNGTQTYPMIVDTGASVTLITNSTAASLAVVSQGQFEASTANGQVTLNVGFVTSIEVNGAKINNVPVAIGLPNLPVGLLGHAFFDNYDVVVQEEVIEFRPRQQKH